MILANKNGSIHAVSLIRKVGTSWVYRYHRKDDCEITANNGAYKLFATHEEAEAWIKERGDSK